MKFSLITATLGRVHEIEDLLISLSKQTYKDFELIMVDQNEHRLVEELVGKYQDLFTIKYIRSNNKGLSLNRNVGMKVATGNIIGFPDDDCYYSDNVLEKAVENLQNPEIKFVCIEAIDLLTDQKFINNPNRLLNRGDIMKFCISYNVFLNFNPKISFDEKLGVGAQFSSGEETDYLWTAISLEDKGVFAENALVFHPQNSSSNNYQRAYSYGLGFGAIYKKEYFRTKQVSILLQFAKYLFRSLGGVILSENKNFYYKTLIGRIKGFVNFKNN